MPKHHYLAHTLLDILLMLLKPIDRMGWIKVMSSKKYFFLSGVGGGMKVINLPFQFYYKRDSILLFKKGQKV